MISTRGSRLRIRTAGAPTALAPSDIRPGQRSSLATVRDRNCACNGTHGRRWRSLAKRSVYWLAAVGYMRRRCRGSTPGLAPRILGSESFCEGSSQRHFRARRGLGHAGSGMFVVPSVQLRVPRGGRASNHRVKRTREPELGRGLDDLARASWWLECTHRRSSAVRCNAWYSPAAPASERWPEIEDDRLTRREMLCKLGE